MLLASACTSAECRYLWGVLGNGLDDSLDDACVDVEQVLPGHPRLSGNTCGDEHEVSARQGLPELLVADVPLGLHKDATQQ